jgi:beta-lysine 5,6-aminomutase alpha subunit
MTSKLDLDAGLIAECRLAAAQIAADVAETIAAKTSVAVERTVARLLGVHGANALEIPLPNVLVDHVRDGGELGRGIAYWLGNAMLAEPQRTPQQIAQAVDAGELDVCALERAGPCARAGRVRGSPRRDQRTHGRAARASRAPGREPAAAALRAHRHGQRL